MMTVMIPSDTTKLLGSSSTIMPSGSTKFLPESTKLLSGTVTTLTGKPDSLDPSLQYGHDDIIEYIGKPESPRNHRKPARRHTDHKDKEAPDPAKPPSPPGSTNGHDAKKKRARPKPRATAK